MQTLIKIIILTLLSINATNAQESKGFDVTINVSNLNSNNGKVFVALYNSEANFLNKQIKGEISQIDNKTSTVTFKNIQNGIYAISMFHDENSNNIMDTNFLGIPKEDYGCSNNAKGFMGPPKWEDAKFQINNQSIIQNIKL